MTEEADKKPTIARALAERKIERALMKLELTFAECAGFVVFDEEEQTASWRYDLETKEESIHVGPAVAELDIPSIEMVLRHELLHRSTFHGFGEHHPNHDVANLALDICINRLLFEAYPDQMRKLCLKIYSEEAKLSPIALADPTADALKLPHELQEMWQSIWVQVDGAFPSLSPPSLYFRLLRMLQVGIIKKIPIFCKIDPNLPKQPSGKSDRLVRVVGKRVNERLPRGSDLGRAISEFNVIPIPIGSSNVEQFLEKMRLRKVIDQTATQVLAPLIKEIRVQPYPSFPTRMGLMYQLCGVSEVMGLYWNREVSNTGARMAVGIYADVSGSMLGFLPLVVGFVDALREVPLVIRTFDTSVREIDIEDLAKGKIVGGGGTDFDAPIKDMLDDKNIEAGVLFTDGEARISGSVGKRLRASSKRLYVVYFVRGKRPSSPLDRYAKGAMEVPVGAR